MKRLIICNDGTWNTPDQEDNGIPAPTNVAKLYNALAPGDSSVAGDEVVAQLKYYHPGVGTQGFLDSIAGGAFGKGLNNHICSAYQWIASHYSPGDEIFIFGFSRGAFAARSLGGFLGRGLLDISNLSSDEAWKRVNAAYAKGYQKYESLRTDSRAWAQDWAFFHGTESCPIRFIGVWDTVGALGIPDDLEIMNLFDNPDHWRFHDTALGVHVSTARHAMALDEKRASFTVTRWQNAASHGDAVELWFPGVHSDVGGGYGDTNLSDGALLWMIEESEKAGLCFRPGIKNQIQPKPLGILHNSYKGAFAKLRSRPRAVEAIVPENYRKHFHPSAVIRQAASPIAYPPYRPTIRLEIGEIHSVEIFADTRWNDTGLYLEAGHSYSFSASGQWLNSKDACDWTGTDDHNLTASDIVHSTSSFLGKFETLVKKITQNASTDFLGTRRVEEFPWFSLIGAIANDLGVDSVVPNDGSPNPHQYVNLPDHGPSKSLSVTKSGYLYCFANDVWSLYEKNHGSVTLTVTRES